MEYDPTILVSTSPEINTSEVMSPSALSKAVYPGSLKSLFLATVKGFAPLSEIIGSVSSISSTLTITFN